jgi:excinuclease ABC subunit A
VNGGKITVEGTPEAVAAAPKSFTGQYLKPLLERASVKPQLASSPAKAGAQARKRSRKVSAGEDELPDLIGAK